MIGATYLHEIALHDEAGIGGTRSDNASVHRLGRTIARLKRKCSWCVACVMGNVVVDGKIRSEDSHYKGRQELWCGGRDGGAQLPVAMTRSQAV